MERARATRLRRGAVICALCAWLGPVVASAGPGAKDVEGVVVRLDQEDLVVDLGASRGASDGDVIELWRPITLRHPVTGKTLTDRFLIGSLKLTQVRPNLSIARPEGTLTRSATTGDIVVLRRASAPTKDDTTPSPSASQTPSGPIQVQPGTQVPADPDAQELTQIFDSLAGSDPRTRILRYEEYVRAKPRGKYAAVLYEEALSLRRLLDETQRKAQGARPRARTFSPPKDVLAGTALELVIEIEGEASGAVAQIRNDGEVQYTPHPMRPTGDGYWAVSLPAPMVLAPGLDVVIDAVTRSGESVEIAGTGAHPQHIGVTPLPTAKNPPRTRVTATLSTDLAYWNTPSKNDDRVFQTEGAFGARLADEGLRAVRSGFGVYRGVGGSLHDLDDLHLAPRSVGLTYGYLEGEWGLSPNWGLVGRVIVGLSDSGTNGGGQAFLRIGNDLGTNLLLGGEILGGIGVRGITQLTWASIPRVPIVLRTEVTNQPAGASVTSGSSGTSSSEGEVGARAIAQVGYRFLPELTISIRGSYEGRTINHAGPGFGAEVSTSW